MTTTKKENGYRSYYLYSDKGFIRDCGETLETVQFQDATEFTPAEAAINYRRLLDLALKQNISGLYWKMSEVRPVVLSEMERATIMQTLSQHIRIVTGTNLENLHTVTIYTMTEEMKTVWENNVKNGLVHFGDNYTVKVEVDTETSEYTGHQAMDEINDTFREKCPTAVKDAPVNSTLQQPQNTDIVMENVRNEDENDKIFMYLMSVTTGSYILEEYNVMEQVTEMDKATKYPLSEVFRRGTYDLKKQAKDSYMNAIKWVFEDESLASQRVKERVENMNEYLSKED